MRRQLFEEWMASNGISLRKLKDYAPQVARVDSNVEDLDDAWSTDRLAGVLKTLSYSTEDRRRHRPNSSGIPINGDIYDGLACLRSAVRKYRMFCDKQPPHPDTEYGR